MQNKTSLYLIGISFVSTIGGFLFGYDTAIISGCNTFLESHFQLSPAMLDWVVSSALLGTILGCVVSGAITDKYGRKKALILAALLLTVSAFGSMLPPQFLGNLDNAYWITSSSGSAFKFLIVVRLIGGIGVGITSVVAPIYISELTLPENRGKMVSLYQLSITLGILLAFLIDWFVLNQAGERAGVISNEASGLWNWLYVEELWRGMFGTEIPIALTFLTLLFFVPESPRWLVTKGKNEEAMATMIKIGGKANAKLQMAEIKKMVKNESIQSVESSFLGAVLVGIVNSAFTFVAILNIEKFGRRKLLLIGITGAFLSLTGVGVLFALGSKYVIIPLLFYVASFAFSFGPIVWVIISEIFPTRIRGLAVSIGSFSLMVTGFFITLPNPILIETIKPSGTFFLYALLTLPAIWFSWRFIPETKGKTLEEIERFWMEKSKKKK